MKKLILPILLLLFSIQSYAQGTANVILFTEQGEKFFIILNGLRVNDAAATNVRVTSLTAPNYKMKVIFENKSFGEMDKNLFVNLGSEVTYSIRKNNKGEYKLAPISEVPLAQAPPPPANQVVYNIGSATPYTGVSTTVTEQTTTQTTTNNQGTGANGFGLNMSVNDGVTGENVNVNMNIGVNGTATGGSMGMNMNVSGMETGTSTTTTTTTTTSSGGAYQSQAVQTSGGCEAMTSSAFSQAKTSISGKSFNDARITLAKQILDRNCVTSGQAKEMMELFDFEASKLEIAKYAWHRCLDVNNYYLVNDGFDFEASIEELDQYLKSNPR